MKWTGQLVYVSESLVGRRVGLLEIEDGRWRLSYRHHPLGILDERAERIAVTPVGTSAPTGVGTPKSYPFG
jgi:hypothetical protein